MRPCQVADVCTLARHPTAVSGFLEAVLAEVRPLAAAQMAALQRIRSQEACTSAPIQAWDLPYYLNLAMVTSAPPAMWPSMRSSVVPACMMHWAQLRGLIACSSMALLARRARHFPMSTCMP